MAALKVYGNIISTATQRVLACVEEKGLAYEFVSINMAEEEHKKEPYLSLNPFGQVPALEHGDVKLFESRAINGYIAHEYANNGTQLTYPDKKMATLLVWLEVEAHKFEPASSALAGELFYKPLFGMTTDADAVKENDAKLANVLDVYEKRLSESKYLGGDEFSLVDLHHLPNIQCLIDTPTMELFNSRPHVSAWSKDILSRPSWVKVVEMIKSH